MNARKRRPLHEDTLPVHKKNADLRTATDVGAFKYAQHVMAAGARSRQHWSDLKAAGGSVTTLLEREARASTIANDNTASATTDYPVVKRPRRQDYTKLLLSASPRDLETMEMYRQVVQVSVRRTPSASVIFGAAMDALRREMEAGTANDPR